MLDISQRQSLILVPKAFNPREGFAFYDDFLAAPPTAAAAGNTWGKPSGSAWTNGSVNQYGDAAGVWLFVSTGLLQSNYITLGTNISGGAFNPPNLVFEMRVRTTVLATPTHDYGLAFGVSDGRWLGGATANEIFVDYANSLGSAFTLVTQVGGSIVVAVGTTPVVINKWYRVKVVVSPNGKFADLYVNDVYQCTNRSVPAAQLHYGFGINDANVGNNQAVSWDYCNITQVLDRR